MVPELIPLCRYVAVHMLKTCRNQPERYTSDSLHEIDEQLRDYGLLVVEHLVPLERVFRSGLRNSKWHIQAHFMQTVFDLGAPRHYDNNFYEASHKTVKLAYRAGSRKRGRIQHHPQCVVELVQSQIRTDALMRADARDSCRQKEASARAYDTAHSRAHETGEPQLAATGKTLHLEVLRCLAALAVMAKAMLPTLQLQEEREDLALLPVKLAEYLEVETGSSSLASLPATVWLVNSAVICGRYDWSPDAAILETLRAAGSFHGAEYFDSVAVDPGQDGQLWYGQLRALFKAVTAEGVLQLALVRWYAEVSMQDSSSSLSDRLAWRFGCMRLKWEQQQLLAGRRRERVSSYSVVELGSIVRRQCVVPDCRRIAR